MLTRIVQAVCAWILIILAFPQVSAAQTPPPDSASGLLRTVGFQLGGEQSVRVLSALAGLEVSTAPLGTSTGAFTQIIDPMLNVQLHKSTGFGPTFSERSLTSGRGAFSIGVNTLQSSYGTFAGQDLKSEGFRVFQNAGGDFAPISYGTLNLDMSSSTVVLFASVGLLDDLDVGMAIPWIQVAFDAFGHEFTASGIEALPVPPQQSPFVRGAASAGIGDIAVFGKYRFWKQDQGGAAIGIELRLPTGDKDNLRGLDVTRTLISGIWSRGGTFSPHAKVGYDFWSAEVPISGDFLIGGITVSPGDVAAKDQVLYSFGFDYLAHPRATVTFDLVGSTLRGGGQVGYQRFTPFGNPIEVLVGLPESLTKISVVPGVKWNVWSDLLLTFNALTTVENDGLKATFTPVIGFDWSFHRR
jgi:hypothetical protein